jgi:membrane protein involved in colicin uptake
MSKTVTMILATKVIITDNGHVPHSFGPGICEVPAEFADHWYMKAHGAVKYDPAAKAAELLKEAAALEEAAKIEAEKAAKIEAEKDAKVEAEKDAKVEAEKDAKVEAEKDAAEKMAPLSTSTTPTVEATSATVAAPASQPWAKK